MRSDLRRRVYELRCGGHLEDHCWRSRIVTKGKVTKELFRRFISNSKNICEVPILIFLILVGTSSGAIAQDCITQQDQSVVCTCSAASVNQNQCCVGFKNPFCAPNCAACADPTDNSCCDVEIRGYSCTCIGARTTATGPLSYYLLAVTYEPPGNLSSALYLNGTSLGSQVVVQTTGATGVTAQIQTPVFQASLSYLYGNIGGDSFQMTSNGSWGPQVTSNTNLINHLNDKFWLWTNVDMTATTQGSQLTTSLQPPPGQPVNVIDVTVGELAGVVALPGFKAAQLVNLTRGDMAAILLTNPFVATVDGHINAEPKLDSKRFSFLNEHFQVNGPDNPGDPPSGIGLDTNTQNIHGTIQGYMHQASGSFQLGTSVAFITSASAYAGYQWQYTYQKTTQSNTGTVTDAQGLLKSKTTCWHQGIDLYWDSAFGTYLFHPTDNGSSNCNATPGLMGIVKKGDKRVNLAVKAVMPDGTIWRTSSDVHGVFKFYGLPANVNKGVRVSVPEGYAIEIQSFNDLSADVNSQDRRSLSGEVNPGSEALAPPQKNKVFDVVVVKKEYELVVFGPHKKIVHHTPLKK